MDTSYNDNLHHLNESKTNMNMTKATEDFISWLHTERGIITEIEVLFIISVLLHGIHVIFGWWRRCSSNKYLKYSLWLAYIANNPVFLYTIGLVQSSSFENDLLVTCTFSLLMALGGTNSMTAYSLDDNKQYMRYFIQQSLYALTYLSLSINLNFNNVSKIKITSYRSFVGSVMRLIALVGIILIPFYLAINSGRIYANMTASSFLDIETSDFEDHMKSEHTRSTAYDPVTKQGYDYPVFKKIDPHPTLITVSQIWLSNEGPLDSSGGGQQLKEACLSFALFQLLRRRFFGIACPESKLPKTRDLVLKGLLSDEEAAYRVIAAELAFAHDHFFTSSASFNTKLCTLILHLGVLKPILYVTLLISYFSSNNETSSSSSTSMVPSTQTDKIINAVIMLVLSALEALQIYLYLSSDWAKVKLVRLFISGKDIPYGFRRFYNKLPQILGYWQNKIGQHSLLKDLHGRSLIADITGSLSAWFFGELFEYHSVISRGVNCPGIKGPSHIPLPGVVRSAVARALEASNGELSNGASSLQRNAPQCGLIWACEQENHSSTMLIWHIATEYCELAEVEGSSSDSNSNRTIASSLSSYCAYLMAFVPELLPDHELVVRRIFDKVRRDALDMLSQERTPQAKYRKMRRFKVQPNDERIFVKGVSLGKQLIEICYAERWKILADFWTEMILYTAPSDNTRAHMEHLANGGEFLTHLWALLFHAGIVERVDHGDVPSHGHDIESPATDHNHHEAQDWQFPASGGNSGHHHRTCSAQEHRWQHGSSGEMECEWGRSRSRSCPPPKRNQSWSWDGSTAAAGRILLNRRMHRFTSASNTTTLASSPEGVQGCDEEIQSPTDIPMMAPGASTAHEADDGYQLSMLTRPPLAGGYGDMPVAGTAVDKEIVFGPEVHLSVEPPAADVEAQANGMQSMDAGHGTAHV